MNLQHFSELKKTTMRICWVNNRYSTRIRHTPSRTQFDMKRHAVLVNIISGGNSKIKLQHFKNNNKLFLIRIYDPRVDVHTINIEIIKTVYCFLSFCLFCREIYYIDYTKTFSNVSLIVVQTIGKIAFCDYYCVYTTRFARTVYNLYLLW